VTTEGLEAQRRDLAREAKAILLASVRESRQQTAAEAEAFRLLDQEQAAIVRQIETLRRGPNAT
jgi:cell division protein FtsB